MDTESTPINDKIEILAPDGNKYAIPASDWSEAKSQGAILANQGKTTILAPTGDKYSIPLSDLPDALKQGAKELSSDSQQHLGKVAENLKNIQDSNPFHQGVSNVKHSDLQDPDGAYKLLDPSGKAVSVPVKQTQDLLGQGFKFQDQEAQALFEAHQQNLKNPSVFQKVKHFITEGGPLNMNQDLYKSLDTDTNNSLFSLDPEAKIRLLAQRQATQKGGGLEGAQIGADIAHGANSAAQEGLLLAAPAAAAGKAAVALGKIGAAGIEGTVYNAPNIVKSIVDRDPQGVAEQVALGFGLGSIFGLAGEGLSAIALSKKTAASAEAPMVKALQDVGLSSDSKPAEILAGLGKLKDSQHLGPILNKIDSAMPEKVLTGDLQGKLKDLAPKTFILNDEVKRAAAPELDNILSKFGNSNEHSLSELHQIAMDAKKNQGLLGSDAHSAIMDEINAHAEGFLTTDAAKAEPKLGQIYKEWTDAGKIINKAGNLQVEMSMNSDTLPKNGLFDSVIDKIKTNSNVPLPEQIKEFALSKMPGYKLLNRLQGGSAPPTLGSMAIDQLAKAVSHWNGNSGTKVGSSISKAMIEGSDQVTNMIILDAQAMHAAKIAEIAPFLKEGGKTPIIFQAIENPIKQILGDNVNGLSKEQQFNKLEQTVSMAMGNPDVANQQMSHLPAVFNDHPVAQQAFTGTVDKVKQLVSAALPKSQVSTVPFQKNPYKPSASELQNANNILGTIQNPYSIVSSLKDATITNAQVAAVEAVYPSILEGIRKEIIKQSSDLDLSYQQRLAAAVLLGQPIDPSLKQIDQLQSSLNQNNQKARQQAAPKKAHKAAKKTDDNLTTAQRLEKA